MDLRPKRVSLTVGEPAPPQVSTTGRTAVVASLGAAESPCAVYALTGPGQEGNRGAILLNGSTLRPKTDAPWP